MSRLRLGLALLVFLLGCQKNDQSVQPEKLATSSAAGDPAPTAAATPAAGAEANDVPGPLLPYAKGKNPKADAEPKAEAIPSPDAEPGEPKPKGPDKAAKPGGDKPSTVKTSIKSKVELVKAGAEPRKELRLTPKVGLVDKMTMTMTLAIGMKMGARALPKNPLPPMVVELDLKVTEVRPNGDIRYEFSITKTDVKAPPGADANVISTMRQALSRLKGLGGHAVVTSRGETKEAKVEMPPNLDQQTQQILQGMEQAMNQIVVALPEQPVGVGAQWRTTTAVEQNGIRLSQILTHDLVKLEGETAHCNVSVTQKAPPQKVAAPGGVSLELESLKSSGSGKVVFRLDHIAPSVSDLKLSSALQMGLKNEKMIMDTDMTVEMRSP